MSVYDPNPIERTRRKDGFAIILAGLIKDIWPKLEDRHRVLLPAMLSHMGFGSGFPSQSRLAKMTGFTRKHVNKITSELDAVGIVTKERRRSDKHNGDLPCDYTLTDLDDEDHHEYVLDMLAYCKSMRWDLKKIREAVAAAEAKKEESNRRSREGSDAAPTPTNADGQIDHHVNRHGPLDHQGLQSPIKAPVLASIRNGLIDHEEAEVTPPATAKEVTPPATSLEVTPGMNDSGYTKRSGEPNRQTTSQNGPAAAGEGSGSARLGFEADAEPRPVRLSVSEALDEAYTCDVDLAYPDLDDADLDDDVLVNSVPVNAGPLTPASAWRGFPETRPNGDPLWLVTPEMMVSLMHLPTPATPVSERPRINGVPVPF